MAKNEDLFEESSQGAVSAITGVIFVLSAILVFGGIILMSYAFGPDVPGTLIFVSGCAATFLGFAIPFTFLPLTRK